MVFLFKRRCTGRKRGKIVDIREFSEKLAEATKNMSEAERQALMKMFESVSVEEKNTNNVNTSSSTQTDTGIPDGMTERLKRLKANTF